MRSHVSISDFDALPDSAYIRQRQLLGDRIVPYSASTLWRQIAAGHFPKPIKVSPGITAWSVAEIRRHLEKLRETKTRGRP